MKIAIIVEGKTEQAFKGPLAKFLADSLSGKMPRLDFVPYNGRIPKENKLKKDVLRLLSGSNPADHVLALTDVYNGTRDFADANDAKS